MKKRNLFYSMSLIPIITFPFVTTVSCSKNNGYSNEDTKNVFNAFNGNEIEINILSNDRSLKLTELDGEINFQFSIKDSISNNESNKNYYEKLKKSFDNSKIEFVNYLLPIYNEDINTYLFFKINNNSDYIIKVSLSNILLNEGKMSVANLTQKEISELIKTKLNNEKYFISGLRSNLKSLSSSIVDQYQIFKKEETNANVTLEQYWNDNGFNESIYYSLNNFFVNNYIFFSNAEYKNLVIKNLSIEFNEEFLLFSFDISTSNMEKYPETIYQIKDIKIWL